MVEKPLDVAYCFRPGHVEVLKGVVELPAYGILHVNQVSGDTLQKGPVFVTSHIPTSPVRYVDVFWGISSSSEEEPSWLI